MRSRVSAAEVVVRNGKPVKVILPIDEYLSLLERAEDIEDARTLKTMRRKPIKFRRFEEFLKEHSPDA